MTDNFFAAIAELIQPRIADLDEPAVIEYTRKHLANFKTPRSVVFVDELPRNPGGKVVKPTLREMV